MTFRRSLPLVVGALVCVLFFASLFDPSVQLYYRDTGRLYYPVKLFIAQQLRLGRLPLWDTMTEGGVSLMGQVTPGLLHPATLLYVVLPFDFAFKLNHVLGPLLGAVGAFRLSRRVGASTWSSMAAAIVYGGSGYLISMTGSNLPYALGAGMMPVAVDAVLGFLDRQTAARFAWAGAAFALIVLGGEPQSAWLAGLLAVAWAILQSRDVHGAARNVGRTVCCGLLAGCFAAPALLPPLAELARTDRAQGVSMNERLAFANHPARLAGLLIPQAFDDAPEAQADTAESRSPITEYFDGPAFSDSIVLGAPALLFALAAVATGTGRLLFGAGVFFALASAGEALGIEPALLRHIPGESLFRYAEKLVGPASLLFALAAAIGADVTLSGTKRAARTLLAAAAALAASCGIASGWISAHHAVVEATLLPYGKTHDPHFAAIFTSTLAAGLFDTAGLAAAVAIAALWRSIRLREAAPLAALSCAASVFASSSGLLYRCPIEYVRGPFALAQDLISRSGPSADRWRIFVNDKPPALLRGLPGRLSSAVSTAEALMPQYNVTAGIEALTAYFSLGDPAYRRAIHENPEACFDLFGVRYAIEMPRTFSDSRAQQFHFRKMGLGYWVREYPVRSRAFVVGRATRIGSIEEGVERMSAATFSARAAAVFRGEGAPASIEGRAEPATWQRLTPEHIQVHARGPGLLVIGEHFDPGWHAYAGDHELQVVEADLTALGIPLPEGETTMDMRFRPQGLLPGMVLLALGGAVVLALLLRERHR